MSANKKIDKVKLFKRLSRLDKVAGKAGVHKEKKDRRRSTKEYLMEAWEEQEDNDLN